MRSTIPAAIDNLLAALRARPGLASVQILDGPTDQEIEANSLSIGYVPGLPTLDGEQAPAQIGAQRREETYDLAGQISCWRGDQGDTKAARDAAFAIFGEIEQQLRPADGGDPTLAGAVRYAEIAGAFGFDQQPYEGGIDAVITFIIRCQQRI